MKKQLNILTCLTIFFFLINSYIERREYKYMKLQQIEMEGAKQFRLQGKQIQKEGLLCQN